MCRRRFYACDMLIGDEAARRAGQNYCGDTCKNGRKDGWLECDEVKEKKNRVHPTSKRTDLPHCEEEWPPITLVRACPKCKNDPWHNWPVVIDRNQDPSDPGDAKLKTDMEQWLGETDVLLEELEEQFSKEREMVAQRGGKIAADMMETAEEKADPLTEAVMRHVSTTAQNLRDVKGDTKNGTVNEGTYMKLSQVQSLGGFSVGDKRPADTALQGSQKKPQLTHPSLRASNSQPSKMSTMGGQMGGCSFQKGQQSLMPPFNTAFNLNGPNQLGNRPAQAQVPSMTANEEPQDEGYSSGSSSVECEGLKNFKSTQPGLPTQPASGIYQPASTAEAFPGRVIPSIEIDEDMDLGHSHPSNTHVNGAGVSGYRNPPTGYTENSRQPETLRLPGPTISPSRPTGVPDYEAIQRSFAAAWGPALGSDHNEYSYKFVPTTAPWRVHGAQAGPSNREQDVRAVHGTLYRRTLPRNTQAVGEPMQHGSVQHTKNDPQHYEAQGTQEATAFQTAPHQHSRPEHVFSTGTSAGNGPIQHTQGVSMQSQAQQSAAVQGTRYRYSQPEIAPAAGEPVQTVPVQYKQNAPEHHEARGAQEATSLQTAPYQHFRPEHVFPTGTSVGNGPMQQMQDVSMHNQVQQSAVVQGTRYRYSQPEIAPAADYIQYVPTQRTQNAPTQQHRQEAAAIEALLDQRLQPENVLGAGVSVQNGPAGFEQPNTAMQHEEEGLSADDLVQQQLAQEEERYAQLQAQPQHGEERAEYDGPVDHVDMSGDVRMENTVPMQNPAEGPVHVRSQEDEMVFAWLMNASSQFQSLTQDERELIDAGSNGLDIHQHSAGNGTPEPLSKEEFDELMKETY